MIDIGIPIIVIVGGLIGGAIRSIIGWASQEQSEPFDKQKFIKSLIRSTIGGMMVVIGLTLSGTQLNFIGALFASATSGAGTDVLWHDLYKALTT